MTRAAIVAAATVLALAACSNDRKGLGDAPVGRHNESPRQVWTAPDWFMNVAAYCIGVDGVYVHTREAAPVIIKDDGNCAEGGILHESTP